MTPRLKRALYSAAILRFLRGDNFVQASRACGVSFRGLMERYRRTMA